MDFCRMVRNSPINLLIILLFAVWGELNIALLLLPFFTWRKTGFAEFCIWKGNVPCHLLLYWDLSLLHPVICRPFYFLWSFLQRFLNYIREGEEGVEGVGVEGKGEASSRTGKVVLISVKYWICRWRAADWRQVTVGSKSRALGKDL